MPPTIPEPSTPPAPGRSNRRALLRAPKVSWGGPRGLVLFVLAAVVVVGGGRRWLRSMRSRRVADRLAEPDVTREEILAASEGGRDGLFDLFRLLAPEIDEPRRLAAGEALAILWKRDQLVAEEEKGIVTRGVAVTWHARRRYPRRMTVPIAISVSFRVPFLGASPSGVREEDLEWSYRLKGTGRLSLESFSPWVSGPGRLSFTVDPEDFPGNGPHRLIFQPRVRPKGLTSSWELELPQSSMTFDFDPNLDVDSIRTLHDSERETAMNHALAFEPPGEEGGAPLALNDEFALRAAPSVRLAEDLPCDLAHRIELELEGIAGRFPGGSVVSVAGSGPRSFPIDLRSPLPSETIGRPGPYRMRAILTADSGLGWADPDVRSLWPGTITTPWADVKIVRL